MSTRIGFLRGREEIEVTRYYGGCRDGSCVQLTGPNGYISLTAGDVIALYPVLKKYLIDYVFEEKLKETKAIIEENKELLNTILKDRRDVEQMVLDNPTFQIGALLSLGKTPFEDAKNEKP
jgi:hypothetical protein